MADRDPTIRVKLDSGVCIIDPGKLWVWIMEQTDRIGHGYEYIEGWRDPELGGDPKDVMIKDGGDAVFYLDDPVSTLQLVVTLLINSIPGLEEKDSNWEVDLDDISAS